MRVAVTVTFLRMERPPSDPAPQFPPGFAVKRDRWCSVADYRFLYARSATPMCGGCAA